MNHLQTTSNKSGPMQDCKDYEAFRANVGEQSDLSMLQPGSHLPLGNQPMRLYVNPSTGVLELVPAQSSMSQVLVSMAPTVSQQNIVNVTPSQPNIINVAQNVSVGPMNVTSLPDMGQQNILNVSQNALGQQNVVNITHKVSGGQSNILNITPVLGPAQSNVLNVAQNMQFGQPNVVNFTPSMGQANLIGMPQQNCSQLSSSQHNHNEVRVVVEVKDEQKEQKGPMLLSVGSNAPTLDPLHDLESLPVDDLYRLDSAQLVTGLLEKFNSQSAEQPTDLQHRQAQQLKALIPGLANVCPKFIARIQSAAGSLFQLQPAQLPQTEAIKTEKLPNEPKPPKKKKTESNKSKASCSFTSSPRSLVQVVPKTDPEIKKAPCITIDSDPEEAEHHLQLTKPPESQEDIKLEELSVEIGTTTRSRPCLKLRGYTYYQNRKFNDTVYWLCCEARDIKCKGKVTTDNYR